MLTKLAFKNVSKSLREYAVYFFTLVFGVCIFYMFNSIYAQQEIMAVTETTNESMQALTKMLSYISGFVAVVLGFLIVYANNFFIRRRKKELGIYMTLGMEKAKISKILVLETSFMAIVALCIGLLLGVFGSQFMSVFTAKIFEADLTGYKFIFAPEAALKSVLYFGLIFFVVIVFNTFAIGKFKLIDLIYGGRKNEELRIKNIWISVVIFMVSVVCLGVAYYLILWNGMIELNIYFLMSIIFGTIGTLLFFMSLAGFLIKLVQTNKKLYFKNLNIFVLRQLNSKINTNFVSMSVVCITLLMVIGIFSCGYSLQDTLSNDLKASVKYDISLYNYSKDDLEVKPIYENLPKQLRNDEGIDRYYEYKTYQNEGKGSHFEDYNLDTSSVKYNMGHSPLKFITLSDYNGLRALQGFSEYDLPVGKYAVIFNTKQMNEIAKQFMEKDISLNLNGKILQVEYEYDNIMLDNYSGGITFLVNDDMVVNMRAVNSVLNIQCIDDEACEKLENKFDSYLRSLNFERAAFVHSAGRIEMYNASITTKVLVSFLAIYIGIVFMITSAAILAIQQLSEATDNKERYQLLKKLGADKKMLNKALFSQILCYFLAPLLLAVVHSSVGLIAVNDVIKNFGKVDIAGSIAATGTFVIAVYGLYFGLTYIGSKNIINKG